MQEFHEEQERQSFGNVFKQITTALRDVVSSEIRLAKVEAKATAGKAGRHAAMLLTFAIVAALGVLPLLAFLVVGLGDLLNGNYWLSSLILAVVLFLVGGIGVSAAIKKMKREDFTLPHTRDGVDTIKHHIRRTG